MKLAGWVDGWVDGWMDGRESGVKECLQQSKMANGNSARGHNAKAKTDNAGKDRSKTGITVTGI
jgi:hypothetical protein